MENTRGKRSNEAEPGSSPPPKDSRLGGSPSNIDIDLGSIDETHGLAPQPQANGSDAGLEPGSSMVEGQVTGPVTLEGIAKLLEVQFDKRLSPLSASIEKLTQDLGVFKTKMKDELASMGLKIKQVQNQGSEALTKVQQLEKDMQQLRDGTKSEITKMLSEMKLDKPVETDTNLTVVFGNIPDANTFDKAQGWIAKRCGETGVPKPVEIFHKSEEFTGILFAKCTSASHRDNLISSVRSAPANGGPKPWANIDQPMNIRTAESALFAFKRLLVDWGFNNKSVWVDKEKRILSVEGKEVMKTSVEDFVLKIEWCDGKWEEWSALQSAPEFLTMKTNAQDKLDKVKGYKGKGKGPE